MFMFYRVPTIYDFNNKKKKKKRNEYKKKWKNICIISLKAISVDHDQTAPTILSVTILFGHGAS